MTSKTTIHQLSSDTVSLIASHSHTADLVRWFCSGDRRLTTLLRQSIDQLYLAFTCCHVSSRTNILPPVLRACRNLRRLELFAPRNLSHLSDTTSIVDLFTGIQRLSHLQTLKLGFQYDGLDLAPEHCTFSFPCSLVTLDIACVGLPLCALTSLPSTIVHLTCSIMLDMSEADMDIVSVFPSELKTLIMDTNAIGLIKYIPLAIEELAFRLSLPRGARLSEELKGVFQTECWPSVGRFTNLVRLMTDKIPLITSSMALLLPISLQHLSIRRARCTADVVDHMGHLHCLQTLDFGIKDNNRIASDAQIANLPRSITSLPACFFADRNQWRYLPPLAKSDDKRFEVDLIQDKDYLLHLNPQSVNRAYLLFDQDNIVEPAVLKHLNQVNRLSIQFARNTGDSVFNVMSAWRLTTLHLSFITGDFLNILLSKLVSPLEKLVVGILNDTFSIEFLPSWSSQLKRIRIAFQRFNNPDAMFDTPLWMSAVPLTVTSLNLSFVAQRRNGIKLKPIPLTVFPPNLTKLKLLRMDDVTIDSDQSKACMPPALLASYRAPTTECKGLFSM